MAEDLPDFLISDKGVDIVQSPLHTPEAGVLTAQNVEFIRVQGLGGIGSRAGWARFNVSALAGPVLAVTNVPLDTNVFSDGGGVTPALLVGLLSGSSPIWRRSTNGTSWATFSALALGSYGSLPGTIGGAQLSQYLYFVEYDGSTPTVKLSVWTGKTSATPITFPPDTDGSVVMRASILVANGVIYAACQYALNNRVFSIDPLLGTVTLIGASFAASGDTATIKELGLAYGKLFVAFSGAGVGGPTIFSIDVFGGTSWTTETGAVPNGQLGLSLGTFNGTLYAGTKFNGSPGQSLIRTRTAAGVWSTAFTLPDTEAGDVGGFCTFNGTAFAMYRGSTLLKVYKSTGGSWTEDANLVTLFSLTAGGVSVGQAVLFGGNLYWQVKSAGGSAGATLKRTTGGTWSNVDGAIASSGVLGTVGV